MFFQQSFDAMKLSWTEPVVPCQFHAWLNPELGAVIVPIDVDVCWLHTV
jgi:hypothetical protein